MKRKETRKAAKTRSTDDWVDPEPWMLIPIAAMTAASSHAGEPPQALRSVCEPLAMNGNVSAGGEDSAETSGLAIASLFLGIIWLFGVGSILAILLGFLGMKEIKASEGRQGGWAIALAGVVVGVVGLASLGILIGFLLSSAHHTPQIPGPGP
jgi:hypothetical protein